MEGNYIRAQEKKMKKRCGICHVWTRLGCYHYYEGGCYHRKPIAALLETAVIGWLGTWFTSIGLQRGAWCFLSFTSYKWAKRRSTLPSSNSCNISVREQEKESKTQFILQWVNIETWRVIKATLRGKL